MKLIIPLILVFASFSANAKDKNVCDMLSDHHSSLSKLILNGDIVSVDQFFSSDLAKNIRNETKLKNKAMTKHLGQIYKAAKLNADLINAETELELRTKNINGERVSKENIAKILEDKINQKKDQFKVQCLISD